MPEVQHPPPLNEEAFADTISISVENMLKPMIANMTKTIETNLIKVVEERFNACLKKRKREEDAEAAKLPPPKMLKTQAIANSLLSHMKGTFKPPMTVIPRLEISQDMSNKLEEAKRQQERDDRRRLEEKKERERRQKQFDEYEESRRVQGMSSSTSNYIRKMSNLPVDNIPTKSNEPQKKPKPIVQPTTSKHIVQASTSKGKDKGTSSKPQSSKSSSVPLVPSIGLVMGKEMTERGIKMFNDLTRDNPNAARDLQIINDQQDELLELKYSGNNEYFNKNANTPAKPGNDPDVQKTVIKNVHDVLVPVTEEMWNAKRKIANKRNEGITLNINSMK